MPAGPRYLFSVCGVAVAAAAWAQPPAPPAGPPPAAPPVALTPAVVEKAAMDVLKDVHNHGAELYNRGDAYGAYRLYEGALVTARPFLAHRPDVQKLIDDALADVPRLDAPKRQAFRLHEVIEAVRAKLKVPPPPVVPPVATKPDDKTPKPMPSKPITPPEVKAVTGTAAGTVTVDGKPAAGVEVSFVALDLPQPQSVKATADDRGVYKFAAPLPAGKYAVTVAPTATTTVPAKYRTKDTSGLTVVVAAGANTLDFALMSK